jgi:CBS domain-containing protein
VTSTLRLDADPVTEAFLEVPLTVRPGTSVGEVLRLLQARRTGAVLVTEDVSGKPILRGIFTERDALKRMSRGEPLDTPVGDAMVQPAVAISRHDTVAHAIRTMSEGGFRRLPVVDSDGCPTGVVSVAGLLHYLVEHIPRTVYNLPPTPHHRTREQEGA